MRFADQDLTQDDFLGGAVKIWQPKAGYRAATDPVFLAASIPAVAGQSVLEIGCGAGTAMVCLCRRVEGLDLHGLELQPEYADLARRNADANAFSMEIHEGDLFDMPLAVREMSFDHVLTNPPFYEVRASSAPSDSGRDKAHRLQQFTLEGWITAGLRRVKPRGYFSIIHRAEKLPEILAVLGNKTGDIRVQPLSAREGRAAGRVIVRARKGSRAPAQLLAPIILHKGERHVQDEDSFCENVRNILRNAQPIVM